VAVIDANLRRLWTTEDVARFARISPRTVQRRVADGKLPAIRLGGVVRFDPDAVVAAIEQPVPYPVRPDELEF
jgi:excisionase family DNA binding protein